jgi:glucokinase
MTSWDLIADIGGTNARFAAVSDNIIKDSQVFVTKGDMSLVQMATLFAKSQPNMPDRCMMAFASPIVDGYANLTNADQSLSVNDIAAAMGTPDVTFINDFAAAAWAMASVQADDVTPLQGPDIIPHGHRLVIGPGTGLGVGTLALGPNGYFAIPGEGGHVRVVPHNDFETKVFKHLRRLWPEVSLSNDHLALEAEAVVSGTGLPKLYQAVALVLNQSTDAYDSKDIMIAAKNGTDKAAVQTADIFKRHLGYVAGDLALMSMSAGGVYITGGIALKNTWLFDDVFLDAFKQGGRYSYMRAAIPLFLYENSNFGLIGAKNALSLRR